MRGALCGRWHQVASLVQMCALFGSLLVPSGIIMGRMKSRVFARAVTWRSGATCLFHLRSYGVQEKTFSSSKQLNARHELAAKFTHLDNS